jgi:hypothetical protein
MVCMLWALGPRVTRVVGEGSYDMLVFSEGRRASGGDETGCWQVLVKMEVLGSRDAWRLPCSPGAGRAQH